MAIGQSDIKPFTATKELIYSIIYEQHMLHFLRFCDTYGSLNLSFNESNSLKELIVLNGDNSEV